MKILLIGGTGMLGFDLHRVFKERGHNVIAPPHGSLEVCDGGSLMLATETHQPDAIINTAALHPVEACERDPDRAFLVNAVALRSLAGICKKRNIALVHFSSDFVFDGRKAVPYVEEDPAAPLNVYGISKAAGEQMVRTLLPEHILIRTASLFGVAGNRAKGCNFVELMLRKAEAGDTIRVVDDVRMSPTSTREVAEQVALLLEGARFGTFHVCNHGEWSWFEFAQRIFELAGVKADLKSIPHGLAGWGGPRPLYSALANKLLQELGLDRMKSTDEALRSYLQERKSAASLVAQLEYKGPRPTPSN
jgi:dTDP-4-dehydrorhamnose reductase